MSVKKPKIYGKSVKKIKGYSIRLLFKEAGKNHPSGKYGIFSGKKIVKGQEEHTSIESGVKAIETLISSKSTK